MQKSSWDRQEQKHDKKSRHVTKKDISIILKDFEILYKLCFIEIGIHKGAFAIAHSQINDKSPLRFFVTNKKDIIINPKIINHTNYFVNSEEAIPNYELKQTSTGKLSRKDMSKSKFNELYQDHICSSVIRIAREVFAYVPVEYARINAVSNLLNSATGHMEEQPILSVIIHPETINELNLDTIDPSDSMKNFVHNMKFNKTSGFSVVEKVELKK